MRYVKWGFWAVLALFVAGFLHYTLPQHDVVRIADTYEKRVDFGENSFFWGSADAGNAVETNRDVFFIQAFYENEKPMVYRNEDTSWGWPPYFKFDTSNLQAEATDLKSVKAEPQWAVVRHYGWRNEFWSIYPNAISVRPVDGPNPTIIPWINIIILTLLAIVVLSIYFRIRRFRKNRVKPVMDDIDARLDAVGDSAAEVWDDVEESATKVKDETQSWFKRWFGSSK